MEPVAKPIRELSKYNGTPEVTNIEYDLSDLVVTTAFPGDIRPIEVVFQAPVGFRVLDEDDLLEFWSNYHSDNGWIYEVSSGGWHELESTRDGYMSKHSDVVKEYLLVGVNECVSVISSEPPKIRGDNAS